MLFPSVIIMSLLMMAALTAAVSYHQTAAQPHADRVSNLAHSQAVSA
jgi:hypothetical protein